MNFQLQIEQIVGRPAIGNSTSEVDAYRLQVNSYLKQSARTIVDLLPVETLIKDCISLPIADDNGLDITDKRLVKVLRNDFGCMEMPLELKSYAQSGSGSIYEPTKRSPVYYIEGQLATGGKIFIKPPPTSSENGKINYIGYPTPLFNHSVIGGFPDTAEYAVVLGSAIRLLQYRINKYLHEDEDVELAQSAQKELGIIVSMYSQELQRLTGQPMAQQQGEQV